MYAPFPPSMPIRIPKQKGLQLSRAPASSHHRRATMTIRGIEEEIRKATNKLDECERCKRTNEQIIQRLEYKLLLLRSDPDNNIYDSHPLSLSSLRTVNKASGRRKGRTKKKGKRKKRKTRRRR